MWMARLIHLWDGVVPIEEDPTLLFQELDGLAWDSALFRERYLYPFLYSSQMQGDVHLGPHHLQTWQL